VLDLLKGNQIIFIVFIGVSIGNSSLVALDMVVWLEASIPVGEYIVVDLYDHQWEVDLCDLSVEVAQFAVNSGFRFGLRGLIHLILNF
jgi:hypothetical protein